MCLPMCVPTLHDFALAKLLHCKRTLALAYVLIARGCYVGARKNKLLAPMVQGENGTGEEAKKCGFCVDTGVFCVYNY